MEYQNIIKLILKNFNESFNTSAKIIYDNRENILESKPNFKVGNTAGGFYDTKSQTTYIFSETIKKIKNKNYCNKDSKYDNGLTWLIFASFHELEHFLQNQYPEKLKNQYEFSDMMYAVEKVIIATKNFDPEIIDFEYAKKHDNFLLEIDADTKASKNARKFSRYHNITGVNEKYFDLMEKYNNYRINNYDIPILLNQFTKIVRKYPEMLRNKNWINCNKLVSFFNYDGTIKSIPELMKNQNYLTPYIVSSEDSIKRLYGLEVDYKQINFINNCFNKVLESHEINQKKMNSTEDIKSVIEELKEFSSVNGKNSKTSEKMANENYYRFLRNYSNLIKDHIKSMKKESIERGDYEK